MNGTLVVVGGLLLVVAAGFVRRVAKGPEPRAPLPPRTPPRAPRTPPRAPRAPAPAPDPFCTYTIFRTSTAGGVPVGTSGLEIWIARVRRSEESFAVAQAQKTAASAPDPLGGAPGAWVLHRACGPEDVPTSVDEIGVARQF